MTTLSLALVEAFWDLQGDAPSWGSGEFIDRTRSSF